MIKRVSTAGDRKIQRKIWDLISKGSLTRHIDEFGYRCYDTEEFERYLANPPKVGRPKKH